MQNNFFYFLRIFGIVILFLVWFFLGISRMKIASFISISLSFLPFISILDTGIVSILFIILNALIIFLAFLSSSILRKTLLVHCLIYCLVVLLTVFYKFFKTAFLYNLSENLLHFYFSPLIPLLFILFFYLLQKLQN